MKGIGRRIRPGRTTRHQDAAGSVRITGAYLAHCCQRRIIRLVSGEQHFISGIVLPEEALDIFLEPRFPTMHGLQNRDRWKVGVSGQRSQRATRLPLELCCSEQHKHEKNRRRKGTDDSQSQREIEDWQEESDSL